MNLKQKVEMHNNICGVLNALYGFKNEKYNDSFAKSFRKYGAPALLIHLDEKVDRLNSLLLNPDLDNDVNESIQDSLRDLANYAIMGLIEMNLNEQSEPIPSVSKNLFEGGEFQEMDIEVPVEYKTDSLYDELMDFTKGELEEIAESLDIKLKKKMNKDGLIAKIIVKDAKDIIAAIDDLMPDDSEEDNEE